MYKFFVRIISLSLKPMFTQKRYLSDTYNDTGTGENSFYPGVINSSSQKLSEMLR